MRFLRAALAGLLVLSLAGPAASQVTVDDFSTAQATLDAPPTDSSTVGGGGILGTNRGLLLERRAGTGTVTAEVSGNALSFGVPDTASGAVTITWDGDTDPETLDPVGLGGVDLTASSGAAFRFMAGVTTSAASVLVRVHTDGSNSSKGALLLPVGGTQDSFLPFEALEVATGTGADLADVGAIEVTILLADGVVGLDLFDVVAPAVAASKGDFDTAGDPLGTVAPGETIEYRVTIDNPGGTATGTTFDDTVDPATMSPGSFRSTPLARDDAYTSFGNLTLAIADGPDDLLANDEDFDGDPVAAVAVTGQATARGGLVDVAADGSFTYTPPAGFVGVDTFTYGIAAVAGDPTEDAAGNAIAVTGTATIDLSRVIWFVDDTHCAAPCGSGTQADPFGSFTQLNGAGGAGDVDGPGDLIYVRTGSGATDTGDANGFELEDSQQLLGEGVALVVGGNTIVSAGTRPVLMNTAGTAGIGITLASDNTIRGLDVGGTGGMGLKNAAMAPVGTLTVEDVAISGAGGVMNLADGGTLAVTLDSATSTTSATRGISLGGTGTISGTLAVTGGTTIDDATGTAIFVTGSDATLDFGATSLGQSTAVGQGIDLSSSGSATFTFDSLAVTTDAGLGVRANGAGTVSIGGTANTVAAVGGPALDVASTTSGTAWTFASLSSSGSSGDGIRLDSLTEALTVTGTTTITNATAEGIDLASNDVAITFQGAGSSITGATGAAFSSNGGTGNVTWAGSITNTAGRAVEVTGRTGGTVSFNGTVTETGTGLSFVGNSTGSPLIDFNGAVSSNTGANIAVAASSNGGATLRFDGGLDVDTTTAVGMSLAGTPAVHVTGGTNTVNTTGGTGVQLNAVALTLAGGGLDVTTTGFGHGVDVTGGTVAITGGGLDVVAANGTGFRAVGGGTVTLSGSGNTVSTTSGNGTAVRIANTTIGGAGVTFRRIDANGSGVSGDPGIALASTGAGSFSVTGDLATPGSGGTIENILGDAVILDGTAGLVSLDYMIIEDIGSTAGGFDTRSQHDAIHGFNVTGGLALDSTTIRRISDMAINGASFVDGVGPTDWNGLEILNSTLQNSNRYHVAGTGDTSDEGMVRIVGIGGTVTIDNSTLEDGGELIDFFVRSGNVLAMTVTDSVFNDSYKEFSSGAVASIGKMCIDVTFQGTGTGTVTIGDQTANAAGNGAGDAGNDFLHCRIASVRVANDAGATGAFDAIVGNNTFVVTDHSSGSGGDFDFPMGGVKISSRGEDSADVDAIVTRNVFDEITNADGGVGQLTLDLEDGVHEVRVDNNTFDTPGNAAWFIRIDSSVSAAVQFQNNTYVQGFFTCPDPSCAGGYTAPGLANRVNLQNAGNLDLTISGDDFAAHDVGFDVTNTLHVEPIAVGGGGNVCVNLTDVKSPHGYRLQESAGSISLFGATAASCAGGELNSPTTNDANPATCRNELSARSVLGGAGNASADPPDVDVTGNTIDVVTSACATPSGGIF